MGKPEIRLHHAQTAEPIITQLCMGNYVVEIYPTQNFIMIRSGIFVPHIREIVDPKCLLGRFSDFNAFYVKWRPSALGCAFWGPVNNAPHLRGEIRKNCPKRGGNMQFSAKSQNH